MDLDELVGRGLSSEVVAALKKVDEQMKAAGELQLVDQVESAGSSFMIADVPPSYGSSSMSLRLADSGP